MSNERPARNLKLTWTRLRRARAWRWLRRGLLGVLVILLVLDAVGVLLTAFPPAVEWEQIITKGFPSGPPRPVQALAVGPDGQSLFAGTDSGIFRSDDNGKSWRAASVGLTALEVWALAQGPDGESMFAGTLGGVFRSDDGGGTWRAVLDVFAVFSLTVGPDGESMFASSDCVGVFRSDDGGRTWRAVNTGLNSLFVGSLAVGPDGQSLFASTQGGVFRSDDNGETWYSILDFFDVSSLVVGPDGQSLFAGTYGGGIFRSDDGGRTWRTVNIGVYFLRVLSLVVGPDGQSFFAGSRQGIHRSNDGGESWRVVLDLFDVYSLAVGPDEQSLFAGTISGVFRSDDGGRTWHYVSDGLDSFDVLSLAVGPDGRSLLANAQGKVFRSDDGEGPWQLAPNLEPKDIPTNAVWGKVSMTASNGEGNLTDNGEVSLTRPGMGWLRSATYYYYQTPPQAIAIHGDYATLYASTGAGMILRDEIPLPLIWGAPTPYLALVVRTWQGIDWVGSNALSLPVGLGLAAVVALIYVYAGIARPNRLLRATVLWLLPRPRHLLVAASYRGYAARWETGDALERLILLLPAQATTGTFTLAELETALRGLGAAFEAEGLKAALSTLVQRSLLARENGAWRLTEPLLAQVQRRELPRDELERLAEQTRQTHPLYSEARRFLSQAGLNVQPADPQGFLCSSDLALWADVSPLYVRLAPGQTLDMPAFQDLCQAARLAFGEDLRGHTALVVIDRPPRAGDLYQIFALRAQQGFTIVPLPRSLMVQAGLDGRETEALKEQLDLYTGRADLYDARAAVSDVLSFFGRSALLADAQRRLTGGQSLLVFGARKVGKSSLLHRLREECGWPVVVVDLEGYVGNLGYVYAEALHAWRAALAVSFLDLPLPEWVELPSTPDPAALAQPFRQAVEQLLDLLAAQPGKPGLLLFLDEVDVLWEQSEYLHFASVLRSIAESARWRGRFALLLAGLEATLNRADRLEGGRNPFYAMLGEAPLGPLEPEDARTMVVSIGGQMGLGYADEALQILIEAGGGHPFLTRQLCSQAARDLERPATVNADQAAQAIEAYLRLARNYLDESLWDVDGSGPPLAQAALLKALADRQPQTEEALISPDLPPGEQRARQLALRHLHDQSLIRQVEGGWELTIPLYRRWIRRYVLNLSKA